MLNFISDFNPNDCNRQNPIQPMQLTMTFTLAPEDSTSPLSNPNQVRHNTHGRDLCTSARPLHEQWALAVPLCREGEDVVRARERSRKGMVLWVALQAGFDLSLLGINDTNVAEDATLGASFGVEGIEVCVELRQPLDVFVARGD